MWNPPDPDEFNLLVWKIAKQIPYGKVSTYGQIASIIPPPDGVLPPQYQRFGSQWVGRAMNATPPDQDIPWQRVINSKGMISLPEGSPAAKEQRKLLENENVIFDENDRVDFNRVGWDGPDKAWLQEQGLNIPKPLKKDNGPTQMSLF